MRVRAISAVLVLAALVALTAFLSAAQHRGAPPDGNFVPHDVADWHLSLTHTDSMAMAVAIAVG